MPLSTGYSPRPISKAPEPMLETMERKHSNVAH
jgi:hypothetical protein